MERATSIEHLISPSVEAMGFDLVRVSLSEGGERTLQVMAERPDGTMTVDDCAELSRAISALLDVEEPIKGNYSLEVSSPGIDRPLVRPNDFERFAGFDAKVELYEPLKETPSGGQKRFKGRLLGLDEARVGLDTAEGRFWMPFDDIMTARLLLTDELVEASLKGTIKVPGARTDATDEEDREDQWQ